MNNALDSSGPTAQPPHHAIDDRYTLSHSMFKYRTVSPFPPANSRVEAKGWGEEGGIAAQAALWDTDLSPLLVQTHRSAAPVKTSTGNNFPRKYQRIPQKDYQHWC